MSYTGFTIPGMTSCGCGGSGGSCSCASEQQSDTSRPAIGAIPGFSPLGGGAHVYGGPAGGGLVPGMVWADPAEPPALLHPPLFPPPGMLSTMQAGEVAGGKRGQSGSNSQPGVTVTRPKPCEYVITLAVDIFAGSDRSGRGKSLLQRVKKLLSKMGPWDCCPKDHPRCTVKLALDINPIRVWTSGGMKPTPIIARFYSQETGSDGRGELVGNHGDAFGLHRSDESGSSIIIPSVHVAMEAMPAAEGGLLGLSPESIPIPAGLEIDGDRVVGYTEGKYGTTLGWPFDVLAVIIHEILHAMGAGHDDDKKDGQIIPNIMNTTWQMGKEGAFQITTKTACEIGSKNRACTGLLRIACCKPAHGAGNPQKPGLPATMGGFIVPGMSVSGSMGDVGRVAYRSQWAMPFLQEGWGTSALPLRDIHGS